MIEEWKEIEWYEGLYEVSNLGRVKSLRFWKVRLLKWWIWKDWHSSIGLSLNWTWLWTSAHRLVGIHFIPNPLNLPYVLHKKEDLDKNWALYNWVDNLYWGTQSENMKDKYKKGRANNHLQLNHTNNMLWKLWKDNPNSKKVNQYSLEWEFIKEWDCIMDVERELWILNQWVIFCCQWKRNMAGGFIWKYNK